MAIQDRPPLPPKQFWDDYEWANQHYQDLVKSYPNRWVGIYHKEVVAADADLDRVEAELAKMLPHQTIPRLFVTDAANIY